MKKALSTWCFPGDYGLDNMLAATKNAGFDGVELTMATDPSAYLHDQSNEMDFQMIVGKCRQAGFAPHALACSAFMGLPITANGEDGQRAITLARRMINTAVSLGIDTVLLLPGMVDESVSYQTAYERAGNAIVELGLYAQPLGVNIALENVWQKFLLSPLEFRHFIEGVNLPNVGAYFDVGNVIDIGYPEHWIDVLGGHIKRVHLKDYKAGSGDWFGFTWPLLGSVNWLNVMAALRGVGYDGWLTCETASTDQAPHVGATAMAKIVDAIMAM
ncbi:MAG: sugar phosphate isomerase/epimerase [Oscillospiraceae bacterium]|nr:sugar phosphate isomerase/epimerase [Oscillospiraceae bacterium]